MFSQVGHATETNAPHSMQNLLPSGTVVLQLEHSIHDTRISEVVGRHAMADAGRMLVALLGPSQASNQDV